MRKLVSTAVGVAVLVLGVQVASALNYVVHVQGRSQQGWKSDPNGARMVLASVPSGWSNVTLSFNGNARIVSTETDSTTNTQSVNYALRTYCGSGTGNSCIVHCYSAGCLRVSKAIDNIRNGVGGAANSLAGLMYIESSGGCHGGTDLAETATSGFTGWLAKLLGQQEAVDKDLTRSAARTTLGYTHDQIGVNMWHMAGGNDVCKKLLGFIKICGGSRIAGNDDGVVPWASSGGYNSSTARTSLCSVSSTDERDTSKHVSSKYLWHRTDTYWISCSGTAASGRTFDHFGIPDFAEGVIEADLWNTGTAYFDHWYWSDTTTEASCSGTGCDAAFANTNNNDFGTKYADGYNTGASSVDARTSQTYGQTGSSTSCAGRCGTAPAGWCGCTTGATNKCGDYYTTHCDYVNQ